jgi:hypothetical protein
MPTTSASTTALPMRPVAAEDWVLPRAAPMRIDTAATLEAPWTKRSASITGKGGMRATAATVTPSRRARAAAYCRRRPS